MLNVTTMILKVLNLSVLESFEWDEWFEFAANFHVVSVLILGTFVQALPIFLDKMFNEYVAVILSVTFVLGFGEVNL